MRTLTLRRAAVAAAAPLALATLAGCGDSQGPTTATDPAAASNAALSTTAKPVGKAQFLDLVKAAGEKITTVRVAASIDLSGQKIPLKGVLDMTGDTPAMQMTVTIPGLSGATEMRLVDKKLYVQMPGGDGKFLEMDLSDPSSSLGSLGGSLDSLDPGSLTSQMKASMLTKVTDRGTTEVAGQQLHHYTAVMDLGALAKRIPDLPSTARLPKTATYDVWLDSEGRFARFTMQAKNTMRLTMSYTDYGTAGHVTAPPASDVTSGAGLLGSLGGSVNS